MATSLCSALALAALLQAPPPPPPPQPAPGSATQAAATPVGDSLLALRTLLDLKVPPVLEELGENLLRACPMWGVLFTASEADSHAAWYMRFSRGLRPDVLIVPLAAWRSDSLLRARVAADLKLAHRRDPDAAIGELVKRRPVCVSMAFERPPEPRPRIGWATRPLVCVAGPHLKEDRVPPRDFVFAALRLALDNHDAWAPPALALYARAARATPPLCEALRTFRLTNEIPSCRR